MNPARWLGSVEAAIHLALRVPGVGPGDEVFVSTLTFAASVNPVLYQGVTPVFVDSEAHSWNMDPELFRAALEERAKAGRLPKAAVLVSLYGQSADIDSIAEACRRYGLILIEDAAEALGTTYEDKTPGSRWCIRTYRDRLQLPHEQRVSRHRPGAAQGLMA